VSEIVTSRDERGVCRVRLEGEHDMATVEQFERAVGECFSAGATMALIDLTATTFIDSTIIGSLIRWSREAQLSEREALAIALGDPAGVVVRTLLVVDVLDRLPFFSSVEAACQALLEGSKPRPQRRVELMSEPELERARKDAVFDATVGRTEILREAARIRLGQIVREQQHRRD
jgi:anti-sigma B factor antagonist